MKSLFFLFRLESPQTKLFKKFKFNEFEVFVELFIIGDNFIVDLSVVFLCFLP